ncbi:putative tail with lipase actitivy [Acinetobacter phage nACB2]|nr:putative tail with lipase actitivy [Acinetobacter phage nACB2]
MSDNKLKIDVVLADVGESGAVLSDFVTQDLHNTDMAKKADLVNGKVNPTQLPSFSELNGVTEEINGLATQLRSETNTALFEAKEYADGVVQNVLGVKADLVAGRVPSTQAPLFKDIQGAKGAIDGLKQSFQSEIEAVQSSLSQYPKLNAGKVSKTVLPSDVVYAASFSELQNSLQTSFSELQSDLETEFNHFQIDSANRFASKDVELSKADKTYVENLASTLRTKSDSYSANEVDSKLGAKPNKTEVYLKTATYSRTEVDATFSAYVGGRKAYTTLALAQAAQASLPANTVVDVTNDGVNNGTYQWNGTVLSKSLYDPLTQAKSYSDSLAKTENNVDLYSTANNYGNLNIDPANGTIRSVSSAVINVFPIVAGETYTLSAPSGFNTTYAKLAVHVDNTTTLGKVNTLHNLTSTSDPNVFTFVAPITGFGFLNVKWGVPLDISTTLKIKSNVNDRVTSIKDIPIEDKSALKASNIETVLNIDNSVNLYSSANNYGNLNIDPANGTIRSVSDCLLNVFPIVAGEKYTLTAPSGFNTTYAKLAVHVDNTTAIGKVNTLQNLTATVDPNVFTFVAPITGFGFLNVKWGASLNISESLMIKSIVTNTVTGVKGIPIRDEKALKASAVVTDYLDLYKNSVKTSGLYVGLTAITAATNAVLVEIKIKPNTTYYIKAPQFMSDGNRYVGLIGSGNPYNGLAITKRDLIPTGEPDVYQFTTTDSDIAFTKAFYTTKLPSQSYDVVSTVSIFEDFVAKTTTPYVSSIMGFSLAKPQNPTVISRFQNLEVWCAGDSITQGSDVPTNGTYTQYLSKAFGTRITNHGSSGARVSRVVDIITAGSGIAQRDTPTAWSAKDPSNLACFTLMIGTNDSDGVVSGSIDQIPAGRFQDYATANEYAALFPNNYLCNIALIIEYIRWKAPKCEIHIIAPPYRNRPAPNSDAPTRITQLIPFLKSVCEYYGVHLILGTYECGFGYKDMRPMIVNEVQMKYSHDGVHLTPLGNEVFGKYVAQKILNFG